MVLMKSRSINFIEILRVQAERLGRLIFSSVFELFQVMLAEPSWIDAVSMIIDLITNHAGHKDICGIIDLKLELLLN